MIVVRLERADSSDQGTFGRVFAPGLVLFSGELPWRDNAPEISCIPVGRYETEWAWSQHFRRMMYLLLDTDPRGGIRAHSANYMGDVSKGYKAQLHGCISMGEKVGVMDGQKALLLSAPAVRRFESALKFEPFILEITNVT